MEQAVYERPREKMQRTGASALSNVELLQVVIGSGGVRTPVAKIARQVNRLLERLDSSIDYSSLIKISGIGVANTLRIIAAVELGKRVSMETDSKYKTDVSQIALSRKLSIQYTMFDGGGRIIDTVFEHMVATESSVVIARKLCAKVLAESAWAIIVSMGYKSAGNQPGIFELSLTNDLQELTRRLSIKLLKVEYVTKSERSNLYKASR